MKGLIHFFSVMFGGQGVPLYSYGPTGSHLMQIIHTETVVNLYNAHYSVSMGTYMYWGKTKAGHDTCVPEDYLIEIGE